MNWQHLQTFVWLRWRLLYNQWRRAGAFNAILMMILTVGAIVTAVPLFIGCFVLGLYLIPRAEPAYLMYAWDGVIAGFLLFWVIGLVAELQRTDPLSLSKFMHLPVSPKGAFLINYLSSLFRLSLLVFGPVMLAFCVALLFTKGMLLLVALLLLAAFLLMVTAITYQFQGWLAALMSNPRRRRTVIVIVTTMFILISQLPNLLNFYAPWRSQQRPDRSATLAEEMAKIGRDAQAQKFTSEELDRRQQEALKNFQLANEQADRESVKNLERTARLVNTVLPVGWLPLGVMEAATGHVMPALLGLLGMTAIGTASLWRAYRTTIGMYQGQMSARKGRPAPAVATSKSTRKPANLLLEARLSGVSEPVSAIALGGLRSLMRSPEAKMMLLTPLITGAVFGSFLFKGGPDIPHAIRPLIGMAAMIVVLFGMMQLMVNQFGFDRDGFRVFVLCAARRRDILLGKNLAFAPLALGMAAILLIVVQLVSPMRIDHVLAMAPLYVTMFLLFCLLMNLLSIYAPVYIAAGSLKPSNPKLVTILIQMVMFTFIFPLTQGITLLPLGIEIMLGQLGWAESVPICLILSLALCAAVVVVYRLLLEWQGSLFQEREQKILETVTHKAA